MQTLTYGLKLPEQGDKGSIFFPALEDDITQLDGHNHNGANSPKLTPAAITNVSQSILAAAWAAVGDGTGRSSQVVTMPVGYTYDAQGIQLRSAAGDLMVLDIEKVGASSYRVYINDNTIALTALYF